MHLHIIGFKHHVTYATFIMHVLNGQDELVFYNE